MRRRLSGGDAGSKRRRDTRNPHARAGNQRDDIALLPKIDQKKGGEKENGMWGKCGVTSNSQVVPKLCLLHAFKLGIKVAVLHRIKSNKEFFLAP